MSTGNFFRAKQPGRDDPGIIAHQHISLMKVIHDIRKDGAFDFTGILMYHHHPAARTVRKGSRSKAFAGARRSLIGIKSRLRTAIVVLAVMLCAIMLLGLKAPAKEGGTKYYKYYTSVTVGYQEDILDIMDRFRDEVHYETADDYMMEVSRINNLEYRTGDLLEVHAGDQLIVPYYSTEFR